MGLEKTQHIGRIIVHPSNPDVVWVAALGALWGTCLLYTSDAADERSSVDLGGRRIIKKTRLTGSAGLAVL